MEKALDFETVDDEVKFWETHSSADYWEEMEKVEFDVDLHRNLLHPKLIFITDQPAQCPRCKQNLEWLVERVKQLQALTEEICKKRMESLKAQSGDKVDTIA